MAVQIVEMEWQGDPAPIYCPACGHPIYEMDKNPQKCPHVLFTYLSEIGNFDYIIDDLKDTVDRINEFAGEEDINPVKTFLLTIDSESTLCFSITTTGIAHGPVSSTVYVAIDFCKANEE
jgi:hypothetical protein